MTILNAYFLLLEAVDADAPTQLEKEGTIRRFEYCTELAWKCIKDYLETKNVTLGQITPSAVLKEAIAAEFIGNGQAWMDALDARNKMSRTYQLEKFEKVLAEIKEQYIHCFDDLYEKLYSIVNE